MKFKKFLAMTLAAAMVFTGVNVSGFGGMETAFAAPNIPNTFTMTYVPLDATPASKVASDTSNNYTVRYAGKIATAIGELENAKAKSATITLDKSSVGTAFTVTDDDASIDIRGAETITIELNGGQIGANPEGINVKCGNLKITDSETSDSDTQIGTITVGNTGTATYVDDSAVNGNPKNNGLLDLEGVKVGAVSQNRGKVTVGNGAIVEGDVTLNAKSPANNDNEKKNVFNLDGGTIGNLVNSFKGTESDSAVAVNLNSGVFTTGDPLDTKYVSKAQQVVKFDANWVGAAINKWAISNATANGLIQASLTKNQNNGKGNALVNPATIVAESGAVSLTNVPGNVTATVKRGNEKDATLDLTTADDVSFVKIAEKIDYGYQDTNDGFKDKKDSVTVNKFVTGATVDHGFGVSYPIRWAVDSVFTPTDLADSIGGGNTLGEHVHEYALTLTAKGDFNNDNAKIRCPGAVTTATTAANYRNIYFTNDVQNQVAADVAIAKINDSKYYVSEGQIQWAAQTAETVEVVRGTAASGDKDTARTPSSTVRFDNLVLGNIASTKFIENDFKLTADPKYTVVKVKTSVRDGAATKTYYTYEITDKPSNVINNALKFGIGFEAGVALADTTGDKTLDFANVRDGGSGTGTWSGKPVLTQSMEVFQTGTYGFISKQSLTVPEKVACAHDNTNRYIGIDTIKLATGDSKYVADMKSTVNAAGKSFEGVTPEVTSGTIFVDQGSFVLKDIQVGVDLLAGTTSNVIKNLPVYSTATRTTDIPQISAYDWYVNSDSEYEKDEKASEEQEKKASYSQAELEQEIGKAVAETRINAVQDEINKGTIVTVEKAKADQDAAIAEATKGMVTADAAKKATDEAVAEATKDMVSKTDADAAKEAAVEAAKTEANQKLTDAEAAKTAAETAKTEAEAKATAAETAKTEAESKLTAAETAKTAAETKLTEANQKVTAAEAKAAAAEAKATAAASKSTVAAVEKGQQVVSKKNIYKVTNVSKKTVAFAGTMSTAKTIKIAKSVKINGVTYKVTSIAAKALKGNKTAKKVVIPNTVKKIGKKAFNGMSGVTFKASKSLKTKANKAK